MENLPKIDLKKQAKESFQIVGEGVSADYLNYISPIVMAKDILDEDGERAFLLKMVKNFPSYSDYMAMQNKVNGFSMADFLTGKGKETVARLDEIAQEVKKLEVEDLEQLKINKILELFREVFKLIQQRESPF